MQKRKRSCRFRFCVRYHPGILPLKHFLEVVILGVGEVLLGGFVVGGSDVVHDVVDIALDLVAVDVDQTRRNLASGGILQVFEVERSDRTLMVDIDHAASAALVVERVDTHTHQRAIGEVESDRRVAANLVANLDGTALDLETELLDFAFKQIVEDVSLANLAQLGMAMLVVAEVDSALGDFLVAEAVEDTFRNHGSTIVDAHEFTLDDARDNHVDNLLYGDGGLVEELRYDDHGIVAGTCNAEGEVTSRATHSADYKPVLTGAGILHDGGGQHATLGLGAVVAEGGAAVGEREVVVDGLGDVDVGNGIVLVGQELGDTVGCRSGIVATNGDKELNLVVGEELEVETLLEVLGSGFEAAHFQDRTTFVENLISCEEIKILHAGFLGEQSRIATMKANDAIAVAKEGFSHRGHNGVHSGSGTAASKYCY